MPYHIADYYIKNFDDMQNEKDFYHCKKFEYKHDFVIVFPKSNIYLFLS